MQQNPKLPQYVTGLKERLLELWQNINRNSVYMTSHVMIMVYYIYIYWSVLTLLEVSEAGVHVSSAADDVRRALRRLSWWYLAASIPLWEG